MTGLLPLLVVLLMPLAFGMVRRSKTQRQHLLQNPLRTQILAAISQNRGLLVQDLQRVVLCSRSTVRYHLSMLAREGLVQVVSFRRQARVFPADMDAEKGRTLAILLRGRTWEVARRLIDTPGAPQSDLTNGLRMTRKIVRKYLDRMEDLALVEAKAKPPFQTYYPTEQLLAAMAEIERLEGTPLTARPPATMTPVDPDTLSRRFMAPALLVPREGPPRP